ncbi:carbamoyltransferase HypF [Nocardioides allogilvus]|uniref:carbamoyltransferase HypF n=1 Tax=Nocardioides allogilvus TaxID=2072017 RepID=UPI000D316BFC|nr:carbamoyltransferase HypF [Nocardioides allogilvus]
MTSLRSWTETTVRQRVVVRGVVQGVGFRPHVARLAEELGLDGLCRNDATSVLIEVEGQSDQVDDFLIRLVGQAPPMARIVSVDSARLNPTGQAGFTIETSSVSVGARTLVAPDAAVCDDCLTELYAPGDRRYRHPFITCTNCGPRFTITRDLPYDRPQTSMAPFPLCASCEREYADPQDRRHHAQPIGCHDCGPRVVLRSPDGVELATDTEQVLRATVAALRGGAIVAVKGIGGYHLACDATSCTAVEVLRGRKRRPDQPFALMARDLETAATLVDLRGGEALLTSPARPIVLLPSRPAAPVAVCVAPGYDELGVMLPYTPLHHLLFADLPDGAPGAPSVLVMTSGNASGEPIAFTDADALDRLAGIADLFLTHDREIVVPCEDSVVAVGPRGPVPVRRSRGFAPLPVALAGDAVVLAAGAEVKNTFALTRDGQAFLSAHVGDLGSLEARRAHDAATATMLRFHRASPEAVVVDPHPAYASTAWGLRLADELDVPVVEVQHHHAHLAALAAEHGRLDQTILGVVFDGTGYGCDRTVWGGEFLVLGDRGTTAERVGHLGAVRLPGGDAGVRNPVRTAALAVLAAGGSLEDLPLELTTEERQVLPGLLEHGTGWVTTSSVGRLFDVVSALLGIRGRVTYEAQAAIELEMVARGAQRSLSHDLVAPAWLPVRTPAGGVPFLDPEPLVLALCRPEARADVGHSALLFHHVLADATATLASVQAVAAETRTIGLTGGVFCNRLLADAVARRLEASGFEVLMHREVPPNDGGLALGQAAVAAAMLAATPTRTIVETSTKEQT